MDTEINTVDQFQTLIDHQIMARGSFNALFTVDSYVHNICIHINEKRNKTVN